jgi:phage minor structural protein
LSITIPGYIQVNDAAGNTVAFLSPEADKIKDCYINARLNEETTLEFYLPVMSDKWKYITPECEIIAGGRKFILLKTDAIDATRDNQGRMWYKVMAIESWKILNTHYKTINNDPDYPAPEGRIIPDVGNITILSGGESLGGNYPVGTAGHALYALLSGTGWSIDTVDTEIDGIFDLETDKESVLANIQEVQKKWGGYLVWNSIGQTVSLRDEDAWQNYTGFQIRYAKNLQNITRTDDNSLVTKLYPYGENDLNIRTVNDNKEYLENYSYTDKVYVGYYQNQDLHTPEEVKEKGLEVLAKMCKPRRNYRTKIADLRALPEYQHEDFNLGDIVDVIDNDLGINVRARIIQHKYNVFMPWQCELEIGDPEERLASKLSDSINWGKHFEEIVNSSGKIPAFYLVDGSIISSKIADAAVDATKLDAKIIILLDDEWRDNNPDDGYVSWNQHQVVYGGVKYTISAGNTNKKYVYWQNGNTHYSVSDDIPILGDKDFYIVVNNDGIHDLAWYNRMARKFIGSAFIADAAIKTAHIADAQIVDAHIANLSANKIKTGTLNALNVTISNFDYSEIAGTKPPNNADRTSTVIKGGLVTTGMLQVKQGGTVAAGITGNSSGDNAIRFWAGSTYAGRVNAPFRVTQGGEVTTTKLTLTGESIISGSNSYWDLDKGHFRLGPSDTNFKLKFDGTNLVFGGGSIRWDNLDAISKQNLKGEDGIDGISVNWLGTFSSYPANPKKNDAFYHTGNYKSYIYDGSNWNVMAERGPQGSYYAPVWLKSTSIDFRSVSTPEIYANYATIYGTLRGGELEGTRVRQVTGSNIVADLFKDTYGGKLFLYNTAELVNVATGCESGAGDNIGGTLVLYNAAPIANPDPYRRVELGISKDKNAGVINLRKTNGLVKIGINSVVGFDDSHIVLFAEDGYTGNVVIRAGGVSYFNGGNVAIGKTTVTSGYKLDVSGNIKCNTISTINYGTSNPSGGNNGDLYFQYS